MDLFDDIDDMWEYFYGIVQSCMNNYIPLKSVRLRDLLFGLPLISCLLFKLNTKL